MPTYRSISVKLHSQFDIETFPEYIPRSQSYYISRGIPTPTQTPAFVNEHTSTCSVYVRTFPNSQFWLSYAVSPPVPDDQHFLLKLYINGAHIVSWSTGKEDGWKGKTMFALFEVEDEEGRKRVEKRVLCFTKPNRRGGERDDIEDLFDEDTSLEVRVHRALGKKRVERKVEEYGMTEHGKSERGICLTSAGRAGSEQPKRFYKFALIDPVDKPFATFRYYYRTRTQIRELGLSEDEIIEEGEDNELSIIEPYDTDNTQTGEGEGGHVAHQGVYNVFQPSHDGTEDPLSSSLKTYTSTGMRSIGHKERSDGQDRAPARLGISRIPSYRLSVPPSCKLDPPEHLTRLVPTIPRKHDPDVDTSYQPHPVYPLNDWETRTPSPVQSLRDTISTPTIRRSTRRGLTPARWLSAVASAWRRRGTPSNLSSDDGSRAAS